MKLNFKNLIPLIPILFLLFYNKLIVNFYIKLFIILIIIALLIYNANVNKAIKKPKTLIFFLVLSFLTTAFFVFKN